VRDEFELLELSGELDLTNARSVDEALAGTTARTVIFDLSALGFIDSTGMRTIDQAHRRFASDGRILLIVAAEDSTAGWTFRIAGFEPGLVLESREDAERQIGESEHVG
jgi:anti-anti-sigma factor